MFQGITLPRRHDLGARGVALSYLQTSDRLDCRVRDMGGSQSAIRMSVACKVVLGACLAVPKHDAVVSVDLPESVMSTLSMPNTEGCPCVCRLTAMVAVNLSPSST